LPLQRQNPIQNLKIKKDKKPNVIKDLWFLYLVCVCFFDIDLAVELLSGN